jgi:hypothetical protein
MPELNYEDLMWLYARQGIADWLEADDALKKRARECLGAGGIAESNSEARGTIGTIYDGTNSDCLRFIPMPKVPVNSGIDRCFFLPIRQLKRDGREIVGFELFMLVARTDCLAFRFEPAHSPRSAHGYGHAQLCREMHRKTIEVKGIPVWMPDRYPAFPISASAPLEIFLCMAMAVHGYHTGLLTVLQDIFQQSSRASALASCLNAVKKMLV